MLLSPIAKQATNETEAAGGAVYREMFVGGVRIRFYGDYEAALSVPRYRRVLDACAELTEATASGDGPLLLVGLFADDPYPTIARLSVEFFGREGRTPDRRELVEAYYGVPVPDLSLCVGFAQPEMFDVPLVAAGLEHLYVALNPSPDLGEEQLRRVLHDHLVARRTPPVDYGTLTREAKTGLAGYYDRVADETLGIGRVDPSTGLWLPLLPRPTEGGERGRASRFGPIADASPRSLSPVHVRDSPVLDFRGDRSLELREKPTKVCNRVARPGHAQA